MPFLLPETRKVVDHEHVFTCHLFERLDWPVKLWRLQLELNLKALKCITFFAASHHFEFQIHALKRSTFTFSVLWWELYVRGECVWATVMIRGPRRLKAPHIGSPHDGWEDQLNNMKCVLLVTCSLGTYWTREGGRTGGAQGYFPSFSRLSLASRHSGDWERINNGTIDKDVDLFTCLWGGVRDSRHAMTSFINFFFSMGTIKNVFPQSLSPVSVTAKRRDLLASSKFCFAVRRIIWFLWKL